MSCLLLQSLCKRDAFPRYEQVLHLLPARFHRLLSLSASLCRASRNALYTVSKLQQLADECTSGPARTRLCFAEVYSRLSGLSLAMNAT